MTDFKPGDQVKILHNNTTGQILKKCMCSSSCNSWQLIIESENIEVVPEYALELAFDAEPGINCVF